MARTIRPIIQVTNVGQAENFTAADVANGEAIPLDGNPQWLAVKNTLGAPATVTLNIAQKVDGQTPAARTVTIPATTGDVVIKLGPTGIYQQTDGSQWIDYSAALTVCAYKIVPP